jgi:hypothetical protein
VCGISRAAPSSVEVEPLGKTPQPSGQPRRHNFSRRISAIAAKSLRGKGQGGLYIDGNPLTARLPQRGYNLNFHFNILMAPQ